MPAWPAIADIAAGVKKGELKAVDLINQSFGRIDETKDFGAVLSVPKDRALSRAEQIDKDPSTAGPLAGVPFVAKDNFLTLDGTTTAAANYLKHFEAPYQATAINKLEEAGAICVAKSNLDAWAHGSSTENSDFFVTKNPYDDSLVAGGSSGGSAAAVATEIAPFSLGTDTGGSVRLPASFCGVIGYKPTYGLISRSGIVAMASSTDVVGVMANTADDTASVIDVLAGKDELDSTTISREKTYKRLDPRIRSKKIGIIKEYFDEGVDDGVRKTVQDAIQKLESAGAIVEEVSLPSLPLALAVYYIVCPAEVSSNLARYDGQRYGLSADSKNLEESYLLSREQGFGAEAKRRVMIGSHVLSSGYYDAYYKKAQTVRTKIIKEFAAAYKRVDFLVGPVSPTTAFKIGEKADDPLKMYLNDIMLVAANISGNPAISVPAGEVGGLPVGLQIIAPQKKDLDLLQITKVFEGVK